MIFSIFTTASQLVWLGQKTAPRKVPSRRPLHWFDHRVATLVASCELRSRRNFPQAMPQGSIVHSRRLFRTEDSSVRKRLPYGRDFRTEESSVRKTLPYRRVFRTEEPSTMDDASLRHGLREVAAGAQLATRN